MKDMKSWGYGNPLKNRRCSLEELHKLLAKVEQDENHWLYQGNRQPYGWGKIWFRGRFEYVHRLFYLIFRGPVPPGWDIHHKRFCKKRNCVNPWHLERHPHDYHAKITNGTAPEGPDEPLPF